MLTITGLRKAFGARDLFDGADLQVGPRERVALIGPNGSGKTTIFDMIAGDQQPDGGQVKTSNDVIIGYLRQETDEMRGKHVMDEVLSAREEITSADHKMRLLEAEISTAPEDERPSLLAEYAHLQARFEGGGGYDLERRAQKILAGLGFQETDLRRKTETFSGGWLMRIALAKLLLAEPDLLLLDEPTNHLDLASVQWLEQFLKSYEGSILFTSHDREFINAFAARVVEIRNRQLLSYKGNFDDFVAQREMIEQQTEAAAKNQSKRIAQTQEFIDRFRYKATKARQVQSRIKMLERMEKVEVEKPIRKAMGLSFPKPARSGRVVLELEGVLFGYGEEPVYTGLDFVIERGHKLALVGPNGAGKTTLLKLAAGALEPQAGSRSEGHNVKVGYFAQHQIEALDPNKTVLKELEESIPRDVTIQPRKLLGRFLFSGDDVEKRVRVLSGGERTRLAMAKLLVSAYNLLCLDEPTNHLDMQSRDVLEEALVDYEGALLLITHDRHLIRSVADSIVEVVDGRPTLYSGDYDYYIYKKSQSEEKTRPKAPTEKRPRATPRRDPQKELDRRQRRLRATLRRVETELSEVTEEIDSISSQLADPDVYSSPSKVADLAHRYEEAKRRSTTLELEWEKAAESLEA
jgi:ATP-binding cassette subfamily F protein 3